MKSPAFKERVVRAAKPEWAYAPSSGEGAARHGGRFNPKGVEALYTSLGFDTCAKEVRFALNTDPFTFWHLEVESDLVLDLSAQSVRKQHGVAWPDLNCPNWESEMNKGIEPACHRLANRLIQSGCHGILVPSFANGARRDALNLVLWDWHTPDSKNKTGARVTVLSAGLLPRDQSSWA